MTDSTNPLQPAQEAMKAQVETLIAHFFSDMPSEQQEQLIAPSTALMDQFTQDGFLLDDNTPEVVQIYEITTAHYNLLQASPLAIRGHMTAFVTALSQIALHKASLEELFAPPTEDQVVEMGFGGPVFGDHAEIGGASLYDEIRERVNGHLEVWLACEMIATLPRLSMAKIRLVSTVLVDAGMEGQDLASQDVTTLNELLAAADVGPNGDASVATWEDDDVVAMQGILKRFDDKWQATDCFFVEQEIELQLSGNISPEKAELLTRIRAANEKLMRCGEPEQMGVFYEEISQLFDQFENTGDANIGDVSGLMATYPKDVH